MWNSRIPTAEVNIHYAQIMKKYCPGFYGFSGGDDTIPTLVKQFFEGKYHKKIFKNYLHYDKDNFLSVNHSASYSLTPADNGYTEFNEKIISLFSQYSRNDTITIPNETICYWGKL